MYSDDSITITSGNKGKRKINEHIQDDGKKK